LLILYSQVNVNYIGYCGQIFIQLSKHQLTVQM